MIATIVLAGGAGRRYGGPKQLHDVSGRPMLERVLAAVEKAPAAERVVVLGAHAEQVLAAIDLHGCRPVVCAGWAAGQAASLHCGLTALGPTVAAALVVLGDGPGLQPAALVRVARAAGGRPQAVLAADYGNGRSHPVLLPRAVWDELPLSGEAPGRSLPAELVDCRDLDPPGDVDYAAG
ncbi:MAG: nucleotidyltransferase family protein [Gaiellales bacterium]